MQHLQPQEGYEDENMKDPWQSVLFAAALAQACIEACSPRSTVVAAHPAPSQARLTNRGAVVVHMPELMGYAAIELSRVL